MSGRDDALRAAREIVAVLGPNAPRSLEGGAKWEWEKALDLARTLETALASQPQAAGAGGDAACVDLDAVEPMGQYMALDALAHMANNPHLPYYERHQMAEIRKTLAAALGRLSLYRAKETAAWPRPPLAEVKAWAERHGVSANAMNDLTRIWTLAATPAPAMSQEAEPDAWLHSVTQGEDNQPDLALSFAPDNFPLAGELGFRSLGSVPLYTHPPMAPDNAVAVQLTRCCGREECGGECGNLWQGMQWVRKDTPPAVAQDDARAVEDRREFLGQLVRQEWMAWAREQPNPKPSWLTPWRELTEPEREVDRRIGERIYRMAIDGLYEQPAARPSAAPEPSAGEDAP